MSKDNASPLSDAPPPEFSRMFSLRKLGAAAEKIVITADEPARKKIAARLKVPSVKALDGVISLDRENGDVMLDGKLTAIVERVCVASLERFDEVVEDEFAIRFAASPVENAEDEIDPEETIVEPLEGEDLDLGEILVQHLSLAMTPFPRKPAAEGLNEVFGDHGDISPFEALKGLKAKE